MNSIEETVGAYHVEITGMTIRQIKDVFEDKWGAMVWSGGAAYPSGDIKLQFKKALAAQPAPRRLTEAEITLLVEAYYDDVGIAPPDLIRQVERVIFRDAQPAHAHAIDTSPERVEKQAGNVQVPEGWKLVPVEPTHAQAKAAADAFLDCGSKLMLNKALSAVRAGIAAAPSTKEPHP